MFTNDILLESNKSGSKADRKAVRETKQINSDLI
jgi:hypothetical protein